MALPSQSPGPKLAYRDLYGEAYHVYYVSFKYRPMGMLVEDRDGVCTVVELQNEDSGELGQAEKEGVRVDDAIVNVMGKDTTNIDFTTITEAIRSASLPFTIGFARPVIAKEDEEAPVLPPAQEQEQVQEEQQPERVVQAQAVAHPLAAPPPPLIDLTTSPIPTDPVSVAPPQAVTAATAAAIGRRLQSPVSVSNAYAHQYMPIAPVPSSQPQYHAVVQQHQGGGGGDPVTGGYIADYLKKAWDQTPGNLDTLLEDLGRRALTNFINRPLDDDDYDDDDGDGCGGRKRKKRRKRAGGDGALRHRGGLLSDEVDARTLCPPEASRAIQEVRERYMRLRNLRFENLRFTDDASEYSRAMLRRAEALQRLESDVGEMLADRVLEVRQKTHELRVADPTLDEALAEKWNEVNEQRKNHLLRKRQTIDRGLLELERIAVEQIPAVSRQIDDELRVRMLPLERLMQDFSILDAEMKKVLGDCRPAGRPYRPPPVVAPPPPPPPPPAPMEDVAGAEGGREGVIGAQGGDGAGRPSLEGSYYAQMPARVGAAYQIHEKDLPCAYSADGTVDPRGRIAGRRDGDGRCRWKPPPQEPGMPIPEELEQFLGRFRPELEEVVLWELYKLGWQITDGAKAHITQLHTDGLLICEQSIEPLTSAEAALFERAMGERWKDFHFAAKLTKKSTKSCIAYYYYQFKGSDAYQRLRIRSVVVTEGGYAASGEDGVDVTGAPYGGFMQYAYAPPPDGLMEG